MTCDCLMNRLMAARFSAWDLHLYLDTHPCDRTAVELLEKYKEKSAELLRDYENRYGPLSPSSGYGEDWTQGPWPWVAGGDC